MARAPFADRFDRREGSAARQTDAASPECYVVRSYRNPVGSREELRFVASVHLGEIPHPADSVRLTGRKALFPVERSSTAPSLLSLSGCYVNRPFRDLRSVRRRSTSESRSRRLSFSATSSLMSSTSADAVASVCCTRSFRRSKEALLELSPRATWALAALSRATLRRWRARRTSRLDLASSSFCSSLKRADFKVSTCAFWSLTCS